MVIDNIQHGVHQCAVLDLLYDLSPEEDLADIDGHLLVLVLDREDYSVEFGRKFTRRIRRLDDSSEFLAAVVLARDFPGLLDAEIDIPAMFHFLGGVRKHRVSGIDECEDFLEEFIENNRCKKN